MTIERAEKPAPVGYDIPGVGKLPRVTAILSAAIDKPHLRAWYAKNGWDACERIKRESATYGTAVHAAVEAINNGQGFEPGDERIGAAAETYRRWFEASVDAVVLSEARVWSADHGFAGTLDAALILKDDPRPVLVDLKTSKACQEPHAEWRLQTIAYVIGALETHDVLCARRLIVQLPSDRPGELALHWLPMGKKAKQDWEAFRACVRLYRWLKEKHG